MVVKGRACSQATQSRSIRSNRTIKNSIKAVTSHQIVVTPLIIGQPVVVSSLVLQTLFSRVALID